jgi:hypothetical protein
MHDGTLVAHLLLVGSISARKIEAESNSTSFSTLSLCAKGLSDAAQNDYAAVMCLQALQAVVDDCSKPTIEEFARLRSDTKVVGFKPEHVHSEWPV